MESTRKLTNLQLEILKVFRFDISEDQVKEIKSLLAAYFVEKVASEMDALFESNKWGVGKIEEWSKEHMRTKYEGTSSSSR